MSLSSEEFKRYNRHIILPEVGTEGQQKLKEASVLVVGAGGLGCPVLKYLAAAGVGKIGIVDFDVVEESNLQRQILYTVNDIGLPKAIQAKQHLALLNPFIELIAHQVKLERENILELMKPYSIIVDGSDNFATRYLVNDACVLLNKPLVFGSIFKFEGQVSVFNYKDGPTYRCLYPEPPKAGEVPNCSEIGVMGILPGIVGTLQATEVIKMIVGIGEVLQGRLLMLDSLSMNFSTISFSLNPANKQIKELIDYEVFCGLQQDNNNEISFEELKKKQQENNKLQLVDVRNEDEFQRFNIGGKLIPLNQLERRIEELSKEEETVLICQSGVRSMSALKLLEKHNFKSVYNLRGGLASR